MERIPPTVTIGTRVPVTIRHVAEILAADAGLNLSRWAAEAIRQRAVRDLAGTDPKREAQPIEA